MSISNLAQALKLTETEFIKQAKNKRRQLAQLATKNVKDAVLYLKVYDTGYLYRHTFCIVNVINNYIDFIFRTVDTPYAPDPYYGFGTSAKYGPRKYLELGSQNTTGENVK